jgi:DNA (cytosine-5)-methyltransferase 1
VRPIELGGEACRPDVGERHLPDGRCLVRRTPEDLERGEHVPGQLWLPGMPRKRPRMLDLMCGGGGCSVGYARAGFDVVGVDVLPHPEYPFELIVADALDVVRGAAGIDLDDFDLVHGSPPCPRWSAITPGHTRDGHPDLIAPLREALQRWGGDYVIENVPGAPLRYPVLLCGSAFGLRVRRHRLFESNLFLMSPGCAHGRAVPVGVYGDHPDREGGWMRPGGTRRGVKATSVADAQHALGIDWMTSWDDLADAVPPAYCELIGTQVLAQLAAPPSGDADEGAA